MLFAAVAGASTEERRADQRATFKACVDGFRDQGVDFSAYNTDENADGVADMVTALGYDMVIYEGASYGTWLGQVLAKRSGGRGADRRRAPAAQRRSLRRTAHQQPQPRGGRVMTRPGGVTDPAADASIELAVRLLLIPGGLCGAVRRLCGQ
jgi:pimeloyl-ACP methyl ester carboxylesterase